MSALYCSFVIMLDNSFFDKIFIIGFGLRQSSSVLIAEHGKRLLHDAFGQQSGHVGGDKIAAHDFIHKAKFHGAAGINPCFRVHHGADFIAGFPGLAHIGVGEGIVGGFQHVSGVVHGAVVFALADTGMGAALYPGLAPGLICATIDIGINYFKSITAGRLVCRTEVLNQGKQVAHLRSEIFVDERRVAAATGNYAIFAPRGKAAP